MTLNNNFDNGYFVIKQSQTANVIKRHSMPFYAIEGANPNVIEYRSLLLGIVFDTRVCVGVFLFCVGYRFQCP
jgi:hypothetical protein